MITEVREKYEAVIGLEVHAQMRTLSKAYSGDANTYGEAPNTQVSIVSLGLPGTLPRFNSRVMEYAVKLGLSCKSQIAPWMHFARKNYFYPDLPKGYQITQDHTPICTGGEIEIKDEEGNPKKVRLIRIHMEEDAGKSIHDQDPFHTLVDLNRAGIPLLEVVTEPDIRSAKEAYNYVSEVRKLVRYLDICDGNMEEGSLRCDANVSVRLKGSEEFGTKVEVKNMNSMSNVARAIEFEIQRQIETLEKGGSLSQETRSYDAVKNRTISMRTKEAANDYRYFPEPDLCPLVVNQAYIDQIQATLPALPNELLAKFTSELGLSEYDANIVVESKPIALYYLQLIELGCDPKTAVNWLMGEIKGYLNQQAIEIDEFPLSAERMAELFKLISDGKVSRSLASQQLFPAMLENPGESPADIAEKHNWIQVSDGSAIEELVRQVVKDNPAEAERFRSGEKKLMGFFMGQLMKASKGKADPKSSASIINKILEE